MLFAAVVVLLAVGGAVALARAGPNTVVPQVSGGSGDLYFTTFHPPTVEHVLFSYLHGRLALGKPSLVTHPPGADGILFATDGRILVGGQNSGDVFSINPADESVTTLPSGVNGSFHLALSPDGRVVYTSGEPGPLAAVPLDPPGAGNAVALHGDDSLVTGMAFAPNGQAIYTSSPPSGIGDVGILDLRTGTTHRLLSGVGAHGVFYDPETQSYLVVGGDTVLQLPVSDPGRVVSELIVRGAEFDQGSATGRGQLLLASNDGTLVLVDYSGTKRVGDTSNPVIQRRLVPNLDDVAPLVGPGGRPVATSAHVWRTVGAAALAAAGVLLAGFLAVSAWRRLRRPGHRLPRWDRRRQRS